MASKYQQGMRIEISGQPVKAENGIFEIEAPFPPQPDGDDYWQWRRIGKNGKLTTGSATANLRGHRASWLDKHAKVIG